MSNIKRKRRQGSNISNLVHRLEELEPRKLLTTLVGGETFWFIDAPNRADARGQLVQVSVRGDAIIELIGAVTDGSTVTLGDLNGVIRTSDIGRAGLDVGTGLINADGVGNDLFAIYVSQASAGASIAISTVNITEDGILLSPYTGVSALSDDFENSIRQTNDAVYDLSVNVLGGENPIIKFSTDIGGVYIGARQLVLRTSTSTQPERLRPVIEAQLASTLGVRAVGIDEVIDSVNNVSAGINVGPSLLQYYIPAGDLSDRMVGKNFDRVLGMAARRDIYDQFGVIMVDTDGLAADGLPVGLELGVVDATTGRITLTSVVEMLQTKLVGNTIITDPIIPGGDLGIPGSDNLFGINIQALASRSDGATFGFNVLRVSVAGVPTSFVQLLQIDTSTGAGTVIAHLQSSVGNINGITATDFDPITGLLFFVADQGEGVGKETRLYSVDVSAGTPAAITASVSNLGQIGDATTIVSSMAFDQTDPATANLWVSGTVNRGHLAWINAVDGSFPITIQALATRASDGETYGFNLVTVSIGGVPTELVQLLQFNMTTGAATVVAHLQGVIGDINAVTAADFDPITGRLFFVADQGEGVGKETRLYSVDVSAGTPAAIAASVSSIGQIGDDTTIVAAMAFDQTGVASADLWVSGTVNGGDLAWINAANASFTQPITIEALATRASDGETYGFNLVTVSIGGVPTELVQLLQINTDPTSPSRGLATVVAHLQGVLGDINGITAADFDPITGRLFFVADQGEGVGKETRLYSVDVSAGTPAAITASVSNLGQIGDATTIVSSMAFDQTGVASADLWVSGTVNDGQLVLIDQTSGAFLAPGLAVTLLGNPVNGNQLTGIAFATPNAAAAEPHVFAVLNTGDINSSILRINLSTGVVEASMLASDPTDGNVLGQAIGGLTWNPTLTNPFTGGVGVLLGTDTVTDSLVLIDMPQAMGSSYLGDTTVSDGIDPLIPFQGNHPVVPDAGITIQALATRASDGATYGFNVVTVDIGGVPTELVQVLSVDTTTGAATVVAHLQGVLGDINGITATDFDPISGLLYFVADKGGGAGKITNLYRVNVDAADALAISASLTTVGQIGDATTTVASMAFDQTGIATANLWVSGTVNGGDLAQINVNTGGFLTAGISVVSGINAINGNQLTGLAFVNPNASAAETHVYATQNTGDINSALLRINLGTGVVDSFSLLSDPTDVVAPLRGQSIGGLSWHPTLINPFTGETGVLIGTDTASDVLVYVDARVPQFSSEIGRTPVFDQITPEGSQINTPGVFEVTLLGNPVNGNQLTGIAFASPNASAVETHVYATQNTGDAGSRLLRIDLTTGNATDEGPLTDPSDVIGPFRGNSIGGLTWHPTLVNPFTGGAGVLLGSDTVSNALLFIDFTNNSGSQLLGLTPIFDQITPEGSQINTPGVFEVTLLGNPVNGNQLTGIAFKNPNAAAAEPHVFAVLNSGDINSSILRINLSTGVVEASMLASDPTDGNVLGQAIGGLTWNPTLTNPFTGGVGVLLGTDTVTDSLVLIDMPQAMGSSYLGDTTVTDPLIIEGSHPVVPDAGITIQALATRASDGATYGFNVVTVDIDGVPTELVQVLSVDTTTGAATVVAHLQNPFLDVNEIAAADFDPISGLLYFVADKGAGVDRVTRLYSVDVDAGTPAQIAATLDAVGVIGNDLTQIESMAFDQTGPGTADLWVSGILNGGVLARVNVATGAFVGLGLPVSLLGTLVTGTQITGLAFANPSASAAETHVFAVMNQGDINSALLRINTTTGVVDSFVLLSDPTDLAAPVRGQFIGGLTWNPVLTNPFTGETGVLVGTDTASDVLVYVDARVPQFSSEIGRTPIEDPINVLGTIPAIPNPSQDQNININIQGLASWSVDGKTYGFNVARVDVGGVLTQLVQLIEFNTDTGAGTVIAHLQGALGDINSITAADFHPVTRRLFFAVDSGDGLTHAVRLYSVDPNAGAAADITATVALIGQIGDSSTQVESIAFDQVGPLPENVNLWVSGTVNGGDLARINPLTAAFVAPGISVVQGAASIDGNRLTGIAFVSPDAAAAETHVFAVFNTGDDNSSLLRIDLATGAAEELGLLAARTSINSTTPVLGTHIGGLTWNPVLTNPFTGELGVLLGTDTASDQLVYIGFDGIATDALQAITYADVMFNDSEHLYGMLNLGGINWLGEFDLVSNQFRKIADLTAINISRINAMAVGLFSSTFNPALGMLLVTDVSGALYELDYRADGGVITSVNTANRRLLGTMTDSDGRVLTDTSIAFDKSGRLLAHDKFNGRLVDIDWQNADGTTVTVGGQVATADGSLRPTVGALALDWVNNRMLAVDNAASWLNLTNEGSAAESAFLMTLSGITNAAPVGQDIENILVGGRVTGRVNLSGSMDMFYAGAILTGNTPGDSIGDPTIPGNFRVAGDLRNLIVSDSIGTNGGGVYLIPYTGRYCSGFDLVVGGRLGQIRAPGTFVGSVTVNNNASVVGYTAGFRPQFEVEQGLLSISPTRDSFTETQVFNLANPYGLYAADGRFSNNTVATAQRLGTLRAGQPGQPDIIHVVGRLQGEDFLDLVDHYAISLLAGQAVAVRLGTAFTEADLRLAVRDPDGRIIATNYSNTTSGISTLGFTADRPGEYTFVVTYDTDTAFTGTPASGLELLGVDYEFRVESVGSVVLGGIVAGTITSLGSLAAVSVTRGDLGSLIAANQIAMFPPSSMNIRVGNGNLRAMVGGSISMISGTQIRQSPRISVPAGHVGLIRSTSSILRFTTAGAVGGDFQMIDSAANLAGSFIANGGIGTIRVAGVFGLANEAPLISVDADNNGGGFIDLIDVAGNMGTLLAGGPQITTGFGGNVRFIRVGGAIFQDQAIQTGDYAPETLNPGISYTHADDGGAIFNISPTSIANPNFNPRLPEGPGNLRFLSQGALTITTYGIRSGGRVLVNVTSTGGGINISGTTSGSAGRGEISSITIAGVAGRAVVTNPLTGQMTLAGTSGDVSVNISGGTTLDVLDIIAPVTGLTSINNSTSGGQIIGIDVASVGSLVSRGAIGLANSRLVSGMTILPREAVSGGDSYPFVDQRTAIIAGNIIEIRGEQGIGNVIVSGNIGTVTANADNADVVGVYEGISAPITATGTIFTVNIGEGVAPTGSGQMSRAGIYAGAIGAVRGNGVGNDIWGDIVSNGLSLANGSSIGEISLHGGSIIGSVVAVYGNFAMASDLAGLITFTGSAGLNQTATAIGRIHLNGVGGILGSVFHGTSIGDIHVRGGFGLINTDIRAIANGRIGNLSIDGYGIRNIGIRNKIIRGGSGGVGNITASGRGQMLATTSFSHSVRQSENFVMHPVFNVGLDNSNDLHLAMGVPQALVTPIGPIDVGDRFRISVLDDLGRTSFVEVIAQSGMTTPADIVTALVNAWNAKVAQTADPVLSGILAQNGGTFVQLTAGNAKNPFLITVTTTNASGTPNQQRLVLSNNRQAGVIDTLDLRTVGNAGTISAYRLSNGIITVSNTLRGITTLTSIDADPSTIVDTVITTGALESFRPGGSISGTRLSVSGPLRQVEIRGSLLNNSIIQATGENGSIDGVRVTGDVDGNIRANARLGPVFVGGNFTGTLRSNGNSSDNRNSLDSFEVRGNMTGDIQVLGNVGRITVARNMQAQSSGDRITISGNLQQLTVGTAGTADIHTLDLPILVQGNLGTLTVNGLWESSLYVGGDLSTATVGVDNNEAGADLLTTQLTVGNNLGSLTFVNGNLAGDIAVGRDIRSVTFRNGNFNAGSQIASIYGNISTVSMTGGSILGEISAENGAVTSITTTGTNAHFGGKLMARTAGTMNIAGNLLASADIGVMRDMNSLTVRGSVLDGADIAVGSLRSLSVTGHMQGDLVTGNSTQALTVNITGNWLPSSAVIGQDVSITVRGNVGAVGMPTTFSLGRGLTSMNVTGSAVMQLLVDHAIGTITVSSLTDSVITCGFDMNSLTINGAMTTSLVQAGISRGADGEFATSLATVDAGETGRMGNISRVSVRNMEGSILAAGGNINSFASTLSVTNSSISSGLSLGSMNIAAVLADTTPLANAAERNHARRGNGAGTDLALFRGDITTLQLPTTASWVNSLVTAGVDPGATGDFASPTVLTSSTGGSSRIGTISGTLGAGSRLITDAPIATNNTVAAGGTVTQVNYNIADITAANPLETLVATVTSTSPFTFDSATAGTVTIRLSGPGSLWIYDELGTDTDNKIDTLRLVGTTSASSVTITSSNPAKVVTIGRVISDDDSTVGTFSFDGDLVGDGSTDADLVIDGGMNSLTLRNLGSAVVGRIGGDLSTARLTGLSAAAKLNVGGAVRTLTVGSSTGSALLGDLATYTSSFNTLSADGIGTLWVHAQGKLFVANPAVSNDFTTPPGAGGLTLVDAYNGSNFANDTLLNMDFLGADLYGIARLYDPNPTAQLANLAAGLDLRGLSVNSAGQVFAINTNSATNKDELVRIDTATGHITVVGRLRNPVVDAPGVAGFTQHILATAFDNSGRLIALVSDRDGNGLTSGNAVTLVEIQTTDADGDGLVDVTRIGNPALQGIQLDAGAVTDGFKGLAVQATTGTLYAIRNTGGLQDDLVTINATTGAVTLIGAVQVNAGGTGITDIRGMGFDAQGNLVAMDRNSIGDTQLIRLAAADLANASAFQRVQEQSGLPNTLDVFTIAKGGSFRTFAYDLTADRLYGNPADPADAQGRALVLGSINTVTGQFTRLRALINSNGFGLTAGASGRAFVAGDNFAGGRLFIMTGDNQLFNYNLAGATLTKVGNVLEGGAAVSLSALDMNDDTGNLVAVDAVQRRLVQVSTSTALVTSLTGAGLVSENLTDLAYDSANNAFIGFVPVANKFVVMDGSLQQGGLTATGFDNVTVIDALGARLNATGNSFGTVRISGGFTGALETPGWLRSLSITGDMGGAVNVGRDLTTFTISGLVTSMGQVHVGGRLGSFTQTGSFDGMLHAYETGTLSISQHVGAGAMIHVTGTAGGLTVNGNFAGMGEFGWMTGAIHVRGLLQGTGRLIVEGDASGVTVTGGTETGSLVQVAGRVNTINIGLTHFGTIAVQQGVGTATFRDVLGGRVFIGMDLDNLNVSGDSANAVYSVGTWIGDDGIYNTADDVITGGVLKSARFGGRFIDSVLAVGVLPSAVSGPGVPTDNRLYVGYQSNGDFIDTAEAGGLLPSRADSVTFSGRIESSLSVGGQRQSVLAVAGTIGRVSTNTTGAALMQRSYSDPAGAPTVLGFNSPSDARVEITFSEAINRDSLRLSSADGDGGTVSVFENDVRLTSATISLRYQEFIDGDGIRRSKLIVDNLNPFAGLIRIVLDGSSDSPIVDRSGLRSSLRDPRVGDPLGTILDGDNNGIEGGDYGVISFGGDAPNNFLTAADGLLTIPLDGGILQLANTIANDNDFDIFGFSGLAGTFLGVNVTSSAPLMMAVFYRDTQGTPDSTDDTFEALARYEYSESFGASSLSQFLELPTDGEYYVVVRSNRFFGSGSSDGASYLLSLTNTTSDADMASNLGGTLTLDGKVTLGTASYDVGYVSNHLRTSKQLVYVNFDGGLSTKTSNGVVSFTSFNPGDLDPMLSGGDFRNTMIYGGTGVTGIMQHVLAVFNDLPASLPGAPVGGLARSIDDLGWAAYQAADTGIWFTTVNPATALGLNPNLDFTTVFVGSATGVNPFLLGEASNIDVAGRNPADEAIVIVNHHAGRGGVGTVNQLLNRYTLALSFTVAHELGHTLGLNHQPTTFAFGSWVLEADDPDNNPLTADDSNFGKVGLMAYPNILATTTQRAALGTLPLTSLEFGIGHLDTQQLLVWWFA